MCVGSFDGHKRIAWREGSGIPVKRIVNPEGVEEISPGRQARVLEKRMTVSPGGAKSREQSAKKWVVECFFKDFRQVVVRRSLLIL